MDSEFQSPLIDFDFETDFLEQASNDASVLQNDTTQVLQSLQRNSKNGKKKKAAHNAIYYVKSKIAQTDTLIQQYLSKSDSFAELEKKLEVARKECQEAHINNQLIESKCEDIRKNCAKLRIENHEFEKREIALHNKQAASESYTKQLQQLIKERDAQIECLKMDKQLDKSNIKDLEKTIFFLKKSREYLTTNLCNVAEVVFTKRILNKKEKIILTKFMRLKRKRNAKEKEGKFCEGETSGLEDEDEHLSDTDDYLEVSNEKDIVIEAGSTPSPSRECVQLNESCDTNYEIDSDLTSDVVSVDTGRGSSLACSENMASPEYFINSPASLPIVENIKTKKSDASTSPIRPLQSIDKATSPILFDVKSPSKQEKKKKHTANSLEKVDKSTSPLKEIGNPFKIPEIVVNGIELSKTPRRTRSQSKSSDKLVDENLNNDEIEMILSNMKLTDQLITPIPPSPSIAFCDSCETLNEEKRILHDNVAKLMEQMKEIKSMMLEMRKNYPTIHQQPVTQSESEESCSYNVSQDYDDITNVIIDKQDLIHSHNMARYEVVDEDIEETREEVENNCSLNDLSCAIPTTCIIENLQFEEPDSSEKEIEELNICALNSQPENDTSDVTIECNNKECKKLKSKKLTRLEKLRQNLLPKSKIKKADLPPSRKLRSRMKPLPIAYIDKKDKESVPLNNKVAYEKAVKVMKDLKLKQTTLQPKRSLHGEISTKKDSSPVTIETKQKEVKDTDVSFCDNHTIQNKDDSIKARRNSSEEEELLRKARKKYPSISLDKDPLVVLNRSEMKNDSEHGKQEREKIMQDNNKSKLDAFPCGLRKRNKRVSVENPEPKHGTRVLRSSVQSLDVENINNEKKSRDKTNAIITNNSNSSMPPKSNSHPLLSYNDLDIFNEEPPPSKKQKCPSTSTSLNLQDSILCKMVEMFAVDKVVPISKNRNESIVSSCHKKIEEHIAHVNQCSPMEAKNAMAKMVQEIEKWNFKDFMSGLMRYLMDFDRKDELHAKMSMGPAPPMTRSEMVVLFVVTRASWPRVRVVPALLAHVEYALFRLNQTPDLRVVESMAHFYAVLCRYIHAQARLRLFIIDAMYCLHFKAIPLIKQCFEVWMHVLPLAHLGIAKSPLVTCLVYLLHYFKCDDRRNLVQDLRHLLNKKYFFKITDWNETKILEMFKAAILEVKDDPDEKRMLGLALLLMAKRHGPKWCQNHIIRGMLMPILAMKNVPEMTKAFCVSMLGPLFKPYPVNMKVHCEISMNQLSDMLETNLSPLMQEAVYSSLIIMSKHNQPRVVKSLLLWHPKSVSPEMMALIKDFVREKPEKGWKSLLSYVSQNYNTSTIT